jgi:hypothetical protein
MTAQMFWILFLVFLIGLFIGSNLGVMLLCVLQVAGQDQTSDESLTSMPAEAER